MDAPIAETQTLFCECGSACGLKLTLPLDDFVQVVNAEQITIMVAGNCPTPPEPADKLIKQSPDGELPGWKIYEVGVL